MYCIFLPNSSYNLFFGIWCYSLPRPRAFVHNDESTEFTPESPTESWQALKLFTLLLKTRSTLHFALSSAWLCCLSLLSFPLILFIGLEFGLALWEASVFKLSCHYEFTHRFLLTSSCNLPRAWLFSLLWTATYHWSLPLCSDSSKFQRLNAKGGARVLCSSISIPQNLHSWRVGD